MEKYPTPTTALHQVKINRNIPRKGQEYGDKTLLKSKGGEGIQRKFFNTPGLMVSKSSSSLPLEELKSVED